jgi:crotonobetainyl-CoA:carnitine CoA-transferase CaiB-like acyl-CoA transferase
MLDVMTAFVLVEHGAGAISSPTEDAGYSRVPPERGPQRTADGWINILPYSATAYDAIFKSGGRDDLVGDNRTRGRNILIHASFLYEAIRRIIVTRTTEEWIAFCTENDISYGQVRNLNDLVASLPVRTHPITGAYRHIPSPIVFSMGDFETTPAPRVGQDTQSVLTEVGVAPERIAELLSSGAARCVLDDPLRDGK